MLYENPEIYDALLPVTAEALHHYTELARRHPGGVLELACGSGQLIVPIAASAPSAVGLDASEPMLAAARRRALEAGVSVDLRHGDMRGFELDRRFSLIFVARNSLLHLHEPDDFAALFSAVRRHLAPGGMLAFDVFNPDLRLLTRTRGERQVVLRAAAPSYGELTVEETSDYDAARQVNRATWFISTARQHDAWVAPLHLRSIFPQELIVLLAANGFRLERRDGDFCGGEFTGTSVHQVCLCRPV
jgi:SAM-dependent methyltransferase